MLWRKFSACFVALLFASVWLQAQVAWQSKPYTEWTLEEARQVLLQSPWMQRQTVKETVPAWPTISPGSGGKSSTSPPDTSRREVGNLPLNQHVGEGGPYVPAPGGSVGWREMQHPVSVYWASSFTVRQGAARFTKLTDDWVLGRRGANDKSDDISRQPTEYAIVVRRTDTRPETSAKTLLILFQEPLVLKPGSRGKPEVPSGWVPQMQSEAKLRENVTLETHRGKGKWKPVRVEFFPDRQNATEIWFYFPRELDGKPLIPPDEDKVKFSCETHLGTLKVEFNPRAMVRDGRPDL